MVGKERDAGRIFDADVDDLFDALGTEAPNLARLRFVGAWLAEVQSAIVAHDQIAPAGGGVDHCLSAVAGGGDESLRASGVEPAVGAERLAADAGRLLGGRAHFSLAVDAINFFASGIG